MGRKSIKVLRTNRILSTGVHIHPDKGESLIVNYSIVILMYLL